MTDDEIVKYVFQAVEHVDMECAELRLRDCIKELRAEADAAFIEGLAQDPRS